ncbi:MAG: gamma-glutamylcyclotransferase [Desulfobacteraceae bacterium]|jgi:gamma-glutamylcyclotransferase (GGCT)/AIG2-like uncharacterized protein YtfP
MKTSKVFVYGTLKVGGRFDYPVFSKARKKVEEAVIKGSLYSLGSFPTVKIKEKGQVHGEVHTFSPDDMAVVMSRMDSIEGYNAECPEKGLYNRHQVKAKLPDGSVTTVWVYEYNGPVTKAERIESGVWEI